jgi:hypothetical protein
VGELELADGPLQDKLSELESALTPLIESESNMIKQNRLLEEAIAANTLALIDKNANESPYAANVTSYGARYKAENTDKYNQLKVKVGAKSAEDLANEYAKVLGNGYRVVVEDDGGFTV